MLEALLNQRRQVGEARVVLERGQDGLQPRHLVAEDIEVVRVAVQQTVGLEEAAAAGHVGAVEVLGSPAQAFEQGNGRVSRELRRFGVDYDEERILEVGKEPGEGLVVQARRKVLGHHLHIVGIDPDVEGRIAPSQHGHDGTHDNDRQCVAARCIDRCGKHPSE